jgi:predicted ATP-grasp superfamily ATP-dependent carboligase
MDALVTDVQMASAVAGLRGLGRAGYRLVALGDRWSAAGLWSRYTAVRAIGPVAERDPSGFASTVIGLAKRHGPLMVYPGWESAISALLDPSLVGREAVLPYPGTDPKVLHALRDKRELGKLASSVGLRVPLPLARGKARDLYSMSVSTPCVVKPARSGGPFLTTRVVHSDDDLKNLIGDLDPSTELLIQELLRGPLLMLAVVLGSDQRLVARFQQIARRTWPSSAGGSSLAVSMPPDDHLVQSVTEMLASVSFSGLAQIDFIDTKEGPVLIDVNPRYYASLPLALVCGVNLPAIWHAVATDDFIPPERSYPAGVSFHWLEADLRAARSGSPRELVHRVGRPRVGAMWARDDPLPSLLLAERSTHGRMRDTLLGRRLRRRLRDDEEI